MGWFRREPSIEQLERQLRFAYVAMRRREGVSKVWCENVIKLAEADYQWWSKLRVLPGGEK